MKRCHNITAWTDYQFNGGPSRIRHVQVLCYDGDKYATVRDLDTGEIEHVKSGYLYRKPERVRMLAKRRIVNWVYWPKTINRRKLERMIPHFVD